MTPGSRYVQLLQAQPNANNGTITGGLAHMLQQYMMGSQMGADQRKSEQDEAALNGRLATALRMGMGTPENVITWNQPTRFDGTGGPTTTIPAKPGDQSAMLQYLASDPSTAPYAWDMFANQRQQDTNLVEVVDPNDPTRMIYVDESQALGMGASLPQTQDAPTIRTTNLPNGMAQDVMWNGTDWSPMGDPYPRWQPQQPATPPAPNFTNFANPATGEVVSIDVSTDAERARQLAAQGFIEVGTNVSASGFGGLSGGQPLGPVGADGKPREASSGNHWEPVVDAPDPTNPDHWRQVPDQGGPNDPTVLGATDRRTYTTGVQTLGRATDALDAYESVLFGPNGDQLNTAFMPGESRAGLQTAYNNLLLELKEAYNLGVLNGPDLELMMRVVADPTDPLSASILMDAPAFKAQLAQIRTKLNEIKGRWDSLYPGMADITGQTGGGITVRDFNNPAPTGDGWGDVTVAP